MEDVHVERIMELRHDVPVAINEFPSAIRATNHRAGYKDIVFTFDKCSFYQEYVTRLPFFNRTTARK